MYILLKGLTKKEILKKNIKVVFLIFLLISSLILIKTYLSNIEKQETKKDEYRTLIFISESITETDINKYERDIENIEIDNNTYYITFKSKESMNLFKENMDSKIDSIINTLSLTSEIGINYVKLLHIIIFFLKILLVILLILTSINYILLINKEIELYKVIGFSKNKILIIYNLFLFIIYSIICFIIILLSLIINRLFFSISINILDFINIYIYMFIYLVIMIIVTNTFIRSKLEVNSL